MLTASCVARRAGPTPPSEALEPEEGPAPSCKKQTTRASYNGEQKTFLNQQLDQNIDEWIGGGAAARVALEEKVLGLAKQQDSLQAAAWTHNMIFNQFKKRKAAMEVENKRPSA